MKWAYLLSNQTASYLSTRVKLSTLCGQEFDTPPNPPSQVSFNEVCDACKAKKSRYLYNHTLYLTPGGLAREPRGPLQVLRYREVNYSPVWRAGQKTGQTTE